MEYLYFFSIGFVILCLYASLHYLLNPSRKKQKNLPPGPPTVPFFGNLLWLLKSSKNFSNLEPVLRQLQVKYGPIVTLKIGSRLSIFIMDSNVAHRVLVKNASVFANRPQSVKASKTPFDNQSTLTSAPYGPYWRFLRHNFLSITNPTRLESYSSGRRWALGLLKSNLLSEIECSGHPEKGILVYDHFHYALFALLCYMCFGEKYDEELVHKIEIAERDITASFIKFNLLNFVPYFSKLLFRNLWKQLLQLRANQTNLLLPLIKARHEKVKQEGIDRSGSSENVNGSEILFYVDTLLDAQVPEEGGSDQFTDDVLVGLASEFLVGGTDTTVNAIQWIMANLVKHQDVQEKLANEINKVLIMKQEGAGQNNNDIVEEEDLQKMPYLKAVILETLRKHPPLHFTLPRAVTEEVVIDGYYFPKDAMINFTVRQMGMDSKVWEDPTEFKPERFLCKNIEGKDEVVDFDLKGVQGIKMMPFGAGRRICPAIGVSMLHMEYFVANLVREFKWLPEEDGCEVDMTPLQAFTIGMKNPLRTRISPRMFD